jgi:hypothetical protein
MNEDSGVSVLEGRCSVGGQKSDGLVVGVAGRLIVSGQPVGVGSVAAREELSVGDAFPESATAAAGTATRRPTPATRATNSLVMPSFVIFVSLSLGP